MATIQLPPDFKEFLKSLNSSKVEYLVVGGYAVNYYGFPPQGSSGAGATGVGSTRPRSSARRGAHRRPGQALASVGASRREGGGAGSHCAGVPRQPPDLNCTSPWTKTLPRREPTCSRPAWPVPVLLLPRTGRHAPSGSQPCILRLRRRMISRIRTPPAATHKIAVKIWLSVINTSPFLGEALQNS